MTTASITFSRCVCCVHCGVPSVSKITRDKKGKNQRTRIYQCLEKKCAKQFSATSGTIGDPQITAGLSEMYQDRPNWPGTLQRRMQPYGNKDVREYIQRAFAAGKS